MARSFVDELLIYREARAKLNAGWAAGRVQAYIGAKYDVTPRTIRNYLRNVRDTLDGIDKEDDSAILRRLIELDLQNYDAVRVAVLNDPHLTEHDERAIEVAASVLADFNPHYVSCGSDLCDFGNISRFGSSLAERAKDAIYPTLAAHQWYNDVLAAVAPQAIRFIFTGNHDNRLYETLTKHHAEFAETALGHFVDTIRNRGNLWLGWDSYQKGVSFGEYLYLMHGASSSIHVAQSTAKNVPTTHQVVIAGHAHRLDRWIVSKFNGNGHTIEQTFVTGCLQKLNPSWGKNPMMKWQHGFALVTIKPRLNMVHVDNVLIHPGYMALVNGKLHQAKPRATVIKMAA